MSELTEVEMVAKIARFGFDRAPSVLEHAELVAEARDYAEVEETLASITRVGESPNYHLETMTLLGDLATALESRNAEVSALREVIEKAIHVEDEYFAQPFMWQVGKMRGILEAGLAPAVASPEGEEGN